jgi:hypothetical protein
MNKESSEIVSVIETYLKEAQNLIPEEIGIRITEMLIEQKLVSDLFAIEVVPLKESYILRTRNLYTSDILGAMPVFCKICGKLLGKTPCIHE